MYLILQNWTNNQQTEILPLHLLKGYAEVWYNSSPTLKEKSFVNLARAMIKQFDTKATKYLLRQELSEKKQDQHQSVQEYGQKVRRIYERIKVPQAEQVHYSVKGLKNPVQNRVMLKQPA